MEKQTLDFYRTHRTNGMSATRAMEYARNQAKRYVEQVESLPYGKARSAAYDSIVPKRRAPIEYNPKSADSGFRWIENVSAGLRVTPAHEIINLRHTGYYVDSFCGDSQHGVVVQIPARNGKPVYFAGVSDPWNNDCARVDFSESYDCPEDAARAADGLAESDAEDMREYDENRQAGSKYAESLEEVRKSRRSFLAARKELKALQAAKVESPELCKMLYAKLHSLADSWQAAKKQAAALWHEYEAQPGAPEWAIKRFTAFKDGATDY